MDLAVGTISREQGCPPWRWSLKEAGGKIQQEKCNRTYKNILPFIEKKLFLKVNREKTVVDYVGKVKFLGFAFYRAKGKARVRIHPKSVEKMKIKVKELTSRSNGMSNEFRSKKLRRYIMGCVNYFKLAVIVPNG